jgi:hypothetical protein
MLVGSYGGMKIIEDPSLKDWVGWDFAKARSPARAARRFASTSHRGRPKRSHRPNSKCEVWKPNETAYHVVGVGMVMHPAMARQLRAALKSAGQDLQNSIDASIMFGRY